MKITLPLPLLLLGLVLVFAGGGAAGYFFKSATVEKAAAGSAPEAAVGKGQGSTVRAVPDTSPSLAPRPGAGESRTAAASGHQDPQTASSSAQPARPLTADELQKYVQEMMGQGWGARGAAAVADLNARLLASDLPALAASLRGENVGQTGEVAFHMVINAWGQKDALAAWNFGLGLPNGPRRNAALAASLQGIVGEDPEAAWRLVSELKEENLSRQLRSTVLMTMAHRDPARAFALATSGTLRDDDFSLPNVIAMWARQDMAAAQAAVATLSGSAQERARSSLLSVLAQSDPGAAWNYAQTLPHNAGEPHRDPRMTVLQTWGKSQPREAMQAALSLPNGALRTSAITTTLNLWAQNDFSSALDYATGLTDSTLRSEALRTLSQNLAGKPEVLFQAVLEHMPAGDNFQRAIDGIFRNWAREDPRQAAAALAQLPSTRLQNQAARQVAQEWANVSVTDALRFAQNLPAGEARNGSLQAVFRTWSGQNLQEALRVFQSLPAEDQRAVLQPMAQSWGRHNPSAALSWSTSLRSADERREFQRQVVSQWAETSPREAAQFAVRLSEEDRGPVVQAAVDRWASRDAEAAANWLASQPAGAWRDGAVAALSRKIAPEDPAVALAWAGSITDEGQRNRQVERVFRDWLRQEPAAARQWLQRTNFSDEQKERLLR